MWRRLRGWFSTERMLSVTDRMAVVNGCQESSAMEEDIKIEVSPLTHDPKRAWEKLQVYQTKKCVKPMPHKTPIAPDKLRFVCVSDTHNRTAHRSMTAVPDGDVLLHAGDFTTIGAPEEVVGFNHWLGSLPHQAKVVIAGNHDMLFDDAMVEEHRRTGYNLLSRWSQKLGEEPVSEFLSSQNVTNCKQLLTNCIYLEDSEVQICGIRIYGSPWQPWFGGWGFNLERGQECLDKWNMIPAGVDIVMTHGPPVGHGDEVWGGDRAGCVELLHTLQQRVKPKYHIFGHIHEDYGVTTDGNITYINASTCNLSYKAVQPAIVFDLPIPEGHSKDELLELVKTGTSSSPSPSPSPDASTSDANNP